ncbi:hypothetical protein DPMN_141452 [Dreissena polymorpha]|uniref:Uncharacterized protein n=1 Tax=Dreissena polymorpha TaxID=45954 RepID=A0A9D4JHP1_DREPO|nr:hypothetical protein DPMN_141452 [Dreissena polymorpha]
MRGQSSSSPACATEQSGQELRCPLMRPCTLRDLIADSVAPDKTVQAGLELCWTNIR